jgi:NodT family efflux transporter outer membrane factor (OMF) lipoprotein
MLGLAGCDLFAENKEQTPPTVPAQFQYAPGPAGAADSWPDRQWWRNFASRELADLIDQAAANNQDLQQALARIAQAEAQSTIAAAPLYPTLQAGGNASRTSTGPNTSGSSISNRTVVRRQYQGTLTASYQIDLFGANRAAASAAEQRVISSRFDADTVALTVNADVATTYLQILAARDRVRLAQQDLQNSERTLTILQQKRGAGLVSDLEVAQQRSTAASQRAAIASLQQSERALVLSLSLLLGRPPEGFNVAAQSLNDLQLPAIVAGMPSGLLLRRPDIRRAESDLKASGYDIDRARAERFPSISLTAEGGTVAAALTKLLSPGTFITSLAASLTAPIFEGNRLEGQQKLAEAQFKELAYAYAKAVYSGFVDVETSLSAAQLYQQQFLAAQEAVNQAQLAYRLAQTRYDAGTIDFLTVLDAQRTVISANDAMVQANLLRYSALVDLYRALGGGFTGG